MFVDESKLFLARIIDFHYITVSERKTQITHLQDGRLPIV